MNNLLLYLKGVAMGIADLVPGVSGGTIALLTGIYNKLITSLAAINFGFFAALLKLQIKRLQKEYNIIFFIVLGSGIISGIAGAASIVHFFLENFPSIIYAFFAGLICASVGGLIHRSHLLLLLFWAGLASGLALNFLVEINFAFTPINIFFAGALAICAMLLPGISGSFILLIIGIYEPLIEAAVNLQIGTLAIFACGAIFMVFTFSKVIFLALKYYQKQTLGFMLGLMVGSLPKLWPWQDDAEGLILLTPNKYSSLISGPSYLVEAVMAFIAAILFVVLLKWIGARFINTSNNNPSINEK